MSLWKTRREHWSSRAAVTIRRRAYQRPDLFFAFFFGRLAGITFLAALLTLLAMDLVAFLTFLVTRWYVDLLAIAFSSMFWSS